MRKIIATVVLVAGLGAAGCSSSTAGGGSGSGGASSAPVTTPATTPASTPVTVPVSSSSAGGGVGGLSQQQAQDALLVAADVGGGFAQTTSDDTNDPLPCTPNAPALDQQFSPSAKAQVDFAITGDKAELSQEITVYSDLATVQQALAAGEKGLSCSSATIDAGTSKVPVTITGPTDLASALDIKVDKCEGWSVTATGVTINLIVSQIGQQLVVLTFSAQTGVDTASLPDTKTVVEKALSKVQAAL